VSDSVRYVSPTRNFVVCEGRGHMLMGGGSGDRVASRGKWGRRMDLCVLLREQGRI
jgi:hypothetical protein